MKLSGKIQSTRYVDLCIVGGAGSGLAAAVRAKELGVEKVLILERNHMVGGCTRVAMQIMGVGSDAQKRNGIPYDYARTFKEHMKIQNWDCDGRLVSRWIGNSGHTLDWLESMGTEFDQILPSGNFDDMTFRNDHQTEGAGITTGSELVRVMKKRCEELGVEILLNTRGRQLIQDDSGRICGIYATLGEEDDADILEVRAKVVILATGSITNNKELIKRMMDWGLVEGATKIEAALKHNTGDGQLMAEDVGAKLGHISPLYMGPHNHPYSNSVCMLMRRPQMFTVNKKGDRYVDESILAAGGGYLWMNGVALNHQPEKICYSIVDEACLTEMLEKREICTVIEIASAKMTSGDYNSNYDQDEDRKWIVGGRFEWMDKLRDHLRSEADAGHVLIADTLDEIAEWIGADPENFKRNVEEYNSFCAAGVDSQFAKDKRFLYPIATPPYYVIQEWQGIDTLIGGVTVDYNLRVLDAEYNPIQGLYAVGVCAGGWLGAYYGMPGSEMSFVHTSGYLAGEAAAKEILE